MNGEFWVAAFLSDDCEWEEAIDVSDVYNRVTLVLVPCKDFLENTGNERILCASGRKTTRFQLSDVLTIGMRAERKREDTNHLPVLQLCLKSCKEK